MNEDKATRYQRHRRVASVASLAWSAVLALTFAASGASAGLRDIAEATVGDAPGFARAALAVVVYVAWFALLNEVATLPFGLYGSFLIERRYGLSRQTLRGWLSDQGKALTLEVVLGGLSASVVYFFIRRFPEWWWLPSGAAFALIFVGLANLGPVLLLPLFYRITPLGRESLRVRLLGLADRAGARVLGVYEWGLSEKTRKANAALTGLAGTRRILVSDTMLAEYSDDEIEVVLAHELAHHVHGDIWKGLLFETVLILVGFFVAAWALREGVSSAGLRGPADVAGLPLLLLAAGAVTCVMLPVAHGMSRAHERRADRFALELPRNPSAFISAMRRLAAQNLAEEQPSKIVEWLFHSHPTIRERIQSAENFR